MNYLSNFSDFLLEHIALKGISTTEFSNAVNINYFVISRWVDQIYYPSQKNLIKVADYFNISIDYMFGLSDVQNAPTISIYTDFVQRFNLLLDYHKIKPSTIANKCEIKKSAISKWLKHQRTPSTFSLCVIATYFDCSIDYLIGRSDFK